MTKFRKITNLSPLRRRLSYVIRNGIQWAEATADEGPRKTLYNRFRRWSENGVFERIFSELVKPQD